MTKHIPTAWNSCTYTETQWGFYLFWSQLFNDWKIANRLSEKGLGCREGMSCANSEALQVHNDRPAKVSIKVTKHRKHKTPIKEINNLDWFRSFSKQLMLITALLDRCLYSFCGWWLLSCRWTILLHCKRVMMPCFWNWGRDKPPWSVRGPCHDEFHIVFFCSY